MPKKLAKQILIAEDDHSMAKAMELKLKKEGFSVTVVSNGEEAVKKLEKQPYDLLMTDVMMPRVSGFELLSYIKEKKVKVPVVVASNLSQEEDMVKAMDLGAKKYFVKSNTSIIEIVDYIKKCLAK